VVGTHESWAQAYGRDSIKILADDTNCSSIAVATVEPNDLARVCVDSTIDLDSILRELAMAVQALKEVWT
jgi:hypothetical protein